MDFSRTVLDSQRKLGNLCHRYAPRVRHTRSRSHVPSHLRLIFASLLILVLGVTAAANEVKFFTNYPKADEESKRIVASGISKRTPPLLGSTPTLVTAHKITKRVNIRPIASPPMTEEPPLSWEWLESTPVVENGEYDVWVLQPFFNPATGQTSVTVVTPVKTATITKGYAQTPPPAKASISSKAGPQSIKGEVQITELKPGWKVEAAFVDLFPNGVGGETIRLNTTVVRANQVYFYTSSVPSGTYWVAGTVSLSGPGGINTSYEWIYSGWFTVVIP